MRNVHATFLRRNGRDFVVQRDDETMFMTKGLKNRKERTVTFHHNTDVRRGDWLLEDDGEAFYVEDIEKPIENGRVVMVEAHYLTKEGLAEKRRPPEPPSPPSQSFVFNAPAYGVFGSQQDFTLEQVIGDLDRLIAQHGGEDEEELREMVAEVSSALENQDSISRSKFERWSTLANKHAPWLLSPLGSLLVNYTFGG